MAPKIKQIEAKQSKKKLGFSTLLVFETILSFFLSLFFLSYSLTGYSVSSTFKETGNTISLYFLVLGVMGFLAILYVKSRK